MPLYLSPFTEPPPKILQTAARSLTFPADLRGRAGLLRARSRTTGKAITLTATEPMRANSGSEWQSAVADRLFPGLSPEEVPDRTLMNGRGEERSIGQLLDALFADYPDKPLDQGGRAIEDRRRRWRFALTDGLTNPTVALLDRFNRLRATEPANDYELLGTAEWWEGESPAHEVKHAGTFIAPPSTVRALIQFLTEGLPHLETRPIVSRAPQIPILYEDEALIVINKPARLASVPGVREIHSAKSILENEHGPLRVVHRLDMDTSGVLLFAKTAEAEKALHMSFREGTALKRYVARLEGIPANRSGTVSLPLAINLLDPPRQCVLPLTEGGKESVTDWELVTVAIMPDGREKAIVNLWPATGRTHQLRMHCAHRRGLDLPIDGDSFYGSTGLLAESGETRLCLHAAMLTIDHPQTGEVMVFECEPSFPLF